jgi:hypothetical protein
MSSVIQTAYPSVEPVSLAEMTNYCKVFVASDNDLITDQITAAREWIEDQTGLCLASRNFIQFEDSLPSIPYGFSGYAYSASQNAYFGYGPLTPYPPMGWNPRVNPFEIQIIRNPVTAIDHIEYIDTFGNLQTLEPGLDFVMDLVSTPARVAPLPGQRWPQGMVGLNNARIYFTAGGTLGTDGTETVTDPDAPTPPDQDSNSFTMTTDIPRALKIAIFQLALHWYENRGSVTAGAANSIPHSLDNIVKSYRVLNINPVTRC